MKMSDSDIEDQGSKLLSHLVSHLEKDEKDAFFKFVKDEVRFKVSQGHRPEDVENAIGIWFYLIIGTLGPEFENEEHENMFSKLMMDVFEDVSRIVSKEVKKLYDANLGLQVEERNKQLEESDMKFRSILESANDVIMYFDPSGRILDINERALQVFASSRKELTGKNLRQLGVLMPKDAKTLMDCFEEVLSGRKPSKLMTITNRGGEEIVLDCTARLVDSSGETLGVMIVARDVTEFTRSKGALVESEEKLRKIFESSPDAITIIGLDGKIVDCNLAALEIHGLSDKEELIGKSAINLVTPKNRESSLKSLGKALELGCVKNVESALLTKNGRELQALVSISVIRDSIGNPVSFLTIAKDITERKEALEKLQRSEERLKLLFECAPDALVLIDAEGTLIDGNRAAEELLGHDREEAIGRTLFDLGVFPPQETDRAFQKLMTTAKGEPTGPDEFVLVRKDGNQVMVETRTFPVNIEGQDLMLASARDITERKKMEEAKNRLLSNTSHELRTPLTSIEGYAKFMLSGKIGELPEKQRNCLKIVVRESNRLRELIDNFLELMAIDTEGPKMNMEEISIARIVNPVVSSMKMELKKKEISISKKLSSGTDRVQGDISKLHQLFSNLLSNAIKFTPNGGSIGVRSKEEGPNIIVELSDSGVGISSEDLPHVFERFYQADNSPARKFGGVGLGLAICNEIAEAHGGHIEVESEFGSGSVFRVYLPKIAEVENGEEEDIGG